MKTMRQVQRHQGRTGALGDGEAAQRRRQGGEQEWRQLHKLRKRWLWAKHKRPKGDAVALRKDHVARACPYETDQCPVALALREATGEPWVIFRAFGGDFYGSENCDDDPRYTLDGDLNGFVARFDEDGVCPTGTLYVDRAAKHIDFLPDPGTATADVAVEQFAQQGD